jgi:hypothetical protein
MSKVRASPSGWGNDSLTSFLDNMRQNQFASFANKQAAKDLVEVERLLRQVVSDAVDPLPSFPFQFMLRGHAVFLTACCSALSGQHYESQVLQRASLESVAYGVFIGSDRVRESLWLSRHNSRQAADDVRNAFGAGKLKRDIAAKNTELGRVVGILYEQSNDFGAHPNERAFFANAALRRDGSNARLDTIYLHRDGIQLDSALKSTVQQGLWNITAFEYLYPALYSDRLSANEVNALKARY